MVLVEGAQGLAPHCLGLLVVGMQAEVLQERVVWCAKGQALQQVIELSKVPVLEGQQCPRLGQVLACHVRLHPQMVHLDGRQRAQEVTQPAWVAHTWTGPAPGRSGGGGPGEEGGRRCHNHAHLTSLFFFFQRAKSSDNFIPLDTCHL